MDFVHLVVLYFSFVVVVLALVAGGWVKIRDYFKARYAAKAAAAAKAAEDAEAAVRARIAAEVAKVKAEFIKAE